METNEPADVWLAFPPLVDTNFGSFYPSTAVLAAFLVAASAALWSGAVVINLVLSETIKQALVPESMLGRATSRWAWPAAR